MEELFKEIAAHIALAMEIFATLIIAFGAVRALIELARGGADRVRPFAAKKGAFIFFGVWLLVGLEFALAADIVRTAIAPTWDQIGQLAAIAAIRTFLNYFLAKDVEKYAEPTPEAEELRTERVVAAEMIARG